MRTKMRTTDFIEVDDRGAYEARGSVRPPVFQAASPLMGDLGVPESGGRGAAPCTWWRVSSCRVVRGPREPRRMPGEAAQRTKTRCA